MLQKPDKLLLTAMFMGLVFHGTTFFFTFDSTYDAYVHIFFGDHYRRFWFEPWEPRWYTGFNVISYPPLVHQLTALFSFVFGLQNAFVFLAIIIIELFIVGAYRFAKLWVTPRAAGYAAVYACFTSSVVQALHLFGQLPTLMGIATLLNALPEIYRWIRYGKYYRLATAVSIMGVGVTSHHVTTIFGMVFFVAPVMGVAVLDSMLIKRLDEAFSADFGLGEKWQKTLTGLSKNYPVTLAAFLRETYAKRKELILFGLCVPLIMSLVFPYFYWSKTDPINQVSIPHGSRDSFIEVFSSGLMFFLIPMGICLLLLPYIFSRVWSKRNFFIGLSFTLLLLLGTGGTTPLPKILLGENAFNILTFDRFTFWATILSIPFIGEFFFRLLEGDFKTRLQNKWGTIGWRLSWEFFALTLCLLTIFIINLGNFRPLQPPTINVKPIVQFLERDQHDKWRYMTLGFGDQMAWLSAQTMAQSVDGNYHSARRLPEMTTRPLERLENSKFKGIQGLGSLQQFLTVSEKYFLKFVFSNDKFYDPILYFSGWERVSRLDNGIMIWQKPDVPPLPSVLPKKDLPKFVKVWWGVMPLTALAFAFVINILYGWYKRIKNPGENEEYDIAYVYTPPLKRTLVWLSIAWIAVLTGVTSAVILKELRHSPYDDPESVLTAYYDAIDFKNFTTAYDYFYPENRPSFEDYFSKLSVEDGILASYAKMDNFRVRLEKVSEDDYKALALAEWVTPVEQYKTKTEHRLKKHGGKWYIEPPDFDVSIPPDMFFEEPMLTMHDQGKRQAGERPTEHDDILDRPELQILNARLVKQDGHYVVVGALQNVDNFPAHITIQANLFDRFDRKLVTYNAKYATIHRILPKETVPFKIEFEATAWAKTNDLDPGQFNPDEFKEFEFPMPPVKFNLFARSVVDKNDLYRSVGVQQVGVNDNNISGQVVNYGTEEVSIPKLLLTYCSPAGDVLWVQTHFLRAGIRQQRKRSFSVPLQLPDKQNLIYEGTEKDFFVNGLPNALFKPLRPELTSNTGVALSDGQTVKIRVDGYIGNPTVY